MTNQEYIKYATDEWMGLVEKKSKLSKQDLYTMETLIAYIIESALQFKEQQLIDEACKWLTENDSYAIPTNLQVDRLREHLNNIK